ncbi:MAG TPA: HNH endonuclease signature motif containing protein [Clostridia bacterium]|nr:HNH endonuclease signature motif containing protein [Clostridia bacterium]
MLLRTSNTTRTGTRFDEAVVQQVWNKGTIVPGYDPNVYRKDACSAWMQRNRHGMTIAMGWEIDHIIPVEHGGVDSLFNLQPLQWQNNRAKSDKITPTPGTFCAVRT